MTGGTQWLDESQQRSWRALLVGMTLLSDRLEDELRAAHGLSLAEYEILVRLSEGEGRQLRMAQLAGAMAHSRSRITHTVSRMEKQGLVERCETPDDRRGVLARLTPKGWELLVAAAHTHVTGVRNHLVDLATPEDFEALGRVMDAVADQLVVGHPEMDIRQ
ncbi:MarR family winged helix-turn-helix transcriptional regulator [Nocardioides sp.]|uniref:MarR family winged helix-turn-helix transcriptional regulator n=1 Tax=Nocardioides sp. TaxID=35761 RepID=UPI0035271884